MDFYTNIVLKGGGQVINFRPDYLTEDPANPIQGQFWFNLTEGLWKGYNGTEILDFGFGGDNSITAATVDQIISYLGATKSGEGDTIVISPPDWSSTTNLAAATTANEAFLALDAAIKANTDLADTKVSKAGDTMTGALDMGGNAITNLPATPSGDLDAVSKVYVDNKISGLSWRVPVDEIVDALPATATAGYRVLNTADGKIYTADDAGAFDAGVTPEDGWAVLNRADESGWVYSGTEWVQFTGAGQIVAGVGLTKDGNTLSVDTEWLQTQLDTFKADSITPDIEAVQSNVEAVQGEVEALETTVSELSAAVTYTVVAADKTGTSIVIDLASAGLPELAEGQGYVLAGYNVTSEGATIIPESVTLSGSTLTVTFNTEITASVYAAIGIA